MVSVISAQDMERYRKYVSSIYNQGHEKDEMIHIVHSILSHFVDHAYGVQTDQITLESSNKSRFQATFDHAKVQGNPQNQTVAATMIGGKPDSSIRGPSEP